MEDIVSKMPVMDDLVSEAMDLVNTSLSNLTMSNVTTANDTDAEAKMKTIITDSYSWIWIYGLLSVYFLSKTANERPHGLPSEFFIA